MEQLDALKDIRNMMERSSRFLSLSGLAGVVVGIFALAAVVVTHFLLKSAAGGMDYPTLFRSGNDLAIRESLPLLLFIFMGILAVSLLTGSLMAIRKAKRLHLPVWDATAKRLAINMFIPLATGGILALILLLQGNYGLLLPVTLIFYGLALVNASKFSIEDIRQLGILETLAGLCAAAFPHLGLLLWAVGFGALHIIYGIWIHSKYER